MEKPVVTDKKPMLMDIEAGRYFWCACGKSANQPYCDGSHKGTGIAPLKVEFEEPKKVAWCMCRHTGKSPFCDGTHKSL
jgi:CDGSH-type Zn-finger protein